MQIVGETVGPEGLALAGRGLMDTTRLASSPAEIWKDIAATNSDEIGTALDRIARPGTSRSPLNVALLGCGTVGGGVDGMGVVDGLSAAFAQSKLAVGGWHKGKRSLAWT